VVKVTYKDEIVMLSMEAEAEGKQLSPRRVLDYGTDPATALHQKFERDDVTAGDKYRLWQARQLIASVKVENPNYGGVRQFISVSVDRKRDGTGGYRLTERVLTQDDLRDMYLSDLIRDVDRMLEKYKQIKEFAVMLEQWREEAMALSAQGLFGKLKDIIKGDEARQ